MSTSKKRRIYIVGGKGRNIPKWLSSAFDYEQFEQDESKTRTLEPTEKPDAVICLKSWCGHEHWYGARDLAERLEVPLINAAGGWSSALKEADESGVEWFIQDIEKVKRSNGTPDESDDEVADFIDNAWREAYEREYQARGAMEKRLRKHRLELEKLRREGEAAKRVIVEVRAAAARQRRALNDVQSRNDRVSEALVTHINSLTALFEATDLSHEALIATTSRVAKARAQAQERLAILQASMEVAEGGPPIKLAVSATKSGTDL